MGDKPIFELMLNFKNRNLFKFQLDGTGVHLSDCFGYIIPDVESFVSRRSRERHK